MTNEEAINMLHGMRADNLNLDDLYTKDKYEALEMAIKALEQEPCGDSISRQAALDLIVANHTELNGVNVVMYSPLCKDIKQLPPVTPKTKSDVLDKIRAEIGEHCGLTKENHCKYCSYCNSVMGVREILDIIDKYKMRGEVEK